MKQIITYINNHIINEHFINCHTKNEMRKYADIVWNDILTPSYEYCNGIKGVYNIDDLINSYNMWKLSRINGKIVCAVIYSTKRGNGRKLCLFGNNQTKEGRDALRKQIDDDFKIPQRNMYGGVSGKAVKWMLERGGVPLPSKIACDIMNTYTKKCIPINEYWYKLMLRTGGYAYKIMVVAPIDNTIDINGELKQQLINQSIEYENKNKLD